jgi:hypothetical protein
VNLSEIRVVVEEEQLERWKAMKNDISKGVVCSLEVPVGEIDEWEIVQAELPGIDDRSLLEQRRERFGIGSLLGRLRYPDESAESSELCE